MKSICIKCGEAIDNPRRNQQQCNSCQKEKADLYYAYSELRYDIWNYLKQHGTEKTKVLYTKMCKDEGVDWTRDALGEKLLKAIGVTGV